MAVSRPDAHITLNGRSFTAAEGAVARLVVHLSVVGAHDAVTLDLWPGSVLAGASPGARMAVSLGERGETTEVWAGVVDEVGPGPVGTRVSGVAHTAVLSRTRVSRSWAGTSAADIVRDLAGEVPVDEVEGTTTFDAYAVDARRTVWRHVLALAAHVGAEVGAAADGGLRFVPPRKGGADVVLRKGAELLEWRVGGSTAAAPLPVFAHGAASESGTWSWLRRDPTGGDPAVVVGAFRQREAADASTKAREARAARAGLHGEVLAVGNPELRAGVLVELDGLEVETVRVREVTHVLDGDRGFTSRLVVEGSGAGAGLLGGLL
jgi:hypothetical protein